MKRLIAGVHVPAWFALGLLVFLQPIGQVAADTKLDLILNPAGFLGRALHAWTDDFTLGQLQNQAYGYLFPQGLFFLLTDPLPDWVAQRLWWWLTLGVGFSGFYLLVSRLGIGSVPLRIIAATLYALSPRTLTTLTAISSETWPAMVAPWICIPLLHKRIDARSIALSLIPVAMIGAVNATATLAALIPAALILAYRRQWLPGVLWSLGVLAVNSWWIGPLLVLGRYAPPFTEFIESAAVTTNWLNPVEILRGTTSWTPFVDTERQAGYLLVNDPLFVMLTVIVAALGLAGLALMTRRGLWVVMLAVGLLILGTAQLEPVRAFLDGPGAALRNIHKFDLLVRMPLMVGVAALGTRVSLPRTLHPGRREAAGIMVVLVALGSVAPAWSGRLLPVGTWDEVPSYWYEATDFINDNASDTRTLILPGSPFARQDWGWTRDEPAQPLLEVPWAVRDAIPLVPPEAIRGLDGLEDSLSDETLKRLGIGAVIVRHDLLADPDTPELDARKHTFGEVDVYLLDTGRDMWLSDVDTPTVAGGGEILSLLDTIGGHSPRRLVDSDALIVTDTPQLVGTNYGNGDSSAALADLSETEVRNRIVDYPSAGPMTQVETEGSISVSSSASDATSFGGSNPGRSPNALVDGRRATSWYPTPGDVNPWLEIAGSGTEVEIIPADDVTVTVRSGESVIVRELERREPATFLLPEASARIELDRYAGIAEITMDGLSRTITVPDTSPDVQQFVFQRLTVPTPHLDRAFTVPRDMTVTVDAESCHNIRLNDEWITCGPLDLPRGDYLLRTTSQWVTLTDTAPAATAVPTGTTIGASPEDRLLLTSRAANPGSRALLDDQPLTPTTIDAAAQAFIIPAGASGEVTFSFAGERPYRISLFAGAGLAALVLLGCLAIIRRPRRHEFWQDPGNAPAAVLLLIPVLGWWFIPAVAAWLIPRVTLIPRWVMASVPLTIAGLWLAQAPWPSATYPGDSPALALLAGISVVAAYAPAGRWRSWGRAGATDVVL
ncbi:alpha-(1-_3)-arabinofuranosyltransferase domain-containing protein [Corynebacterium gallinarum]|uniref:DUF3367 domain-containing protein n=1 Tax=Corynebacterium gallinarum TaxID=2762214 RepID=A0A8I0HMT4_9CORY|nr:alpha-(1->3)-arabinofuranosyltransferase family protein [Corynebacterium gallinarum]MBD8030207.1 DUF3367 domain-containing protein [Corynebacterium gallinarum]